MSQQEEDDLCYICFDKNQTDKPLMECNPCSCKGTIKIHWSCFADCRKLYRKCGACLQPFTMQVTTKDTLIVNGDDKQTYYSLRKNDRYRTNRQ